MSEGASCEEEWVKFILNQKTNRRFQMEKVVNLPQKNKINPGKLIVKQLNNADNNRKQSYETEFEVGTKLLLFWSQTRNFILFTFAFKLKQQLKK